MNENHNKIKILIFESYLTVIKNSIGSQMFKNLYAEINGTKTDITRNGDLSCALFASSILYLFKLIKDIHSTVSGTVRDLEDFGWVKIEEPREGCVIVWKETNFGNNENHKHIGFYIGDKKAISNDSKSGTPTEHPFDFREIESLLWQQKLEE